MRGIGAVTVAGALAGCSGGGNGDGDGGGDTTTTSGDGGGEATASVPSEVDTYLNDNDARLYNGNAVDETGNDTVTVSVGAGEQNYAFDPAAVKISTGTTVEWAWGGDLQHNVVATDGTFESERYTSPGVNFSYTFEEAGNYTYYCTPHRQLGMHGAIIVE
ncbi:halocyanin domain-containing protein [Halorientalis sp. IM1011]|uniref:halocyanin domain-containing protein n=1 Tax=Halorientalis sp. IM1011 TaxID=1932360 RepID=UPI0020A46CB6|nr:halocyanin domain-containing protein [Halorientalis sp. IM1011]